MSDQPKREDFESEEAYDDAVDEYLEEQALSNPKFGGAFAEILGGAK